MVIPRPPTPALIDFEDEHGVRHRLFLVADEADVRTISGMMGDKSCIIADGHHRYTMGLTYWKETNDPAAAYQMMAFTNMRQKGLVVMATHRVVGNIKDFQPQQFLTDLKNNGFNVTKFGSRQDMFKTLAETSKRYAEGVTPVGVYMGRGEFYAAVMEDRSRMNGAAPNMSPAWQTLDIAVLQKLVLERILGLDEEKMGNAEYVEYVKDVPNAVDEIIGRVDSGKRQIAFFTSPVAMNQLIGVTDAGERMPHKSTYFYPKMYTGLTIQKLEV